MIKIYEKPSAKRVEMGCNILENQTEEVSKQPYVKKNIRNR
jgi:hypothetical protein